MKIILSRKGFDTASGGVPSPIFSDGRMLSLPIPDKQSELRYGDIRWNEYDLGTIVSSLTAGRIPSSYKAHLDPDINPLSLKRHRNWRPLLGQVNAAQGHLRKESVERGDIFVFFGLFQEIVMVGQKLEFKARTQAKHVIWGWLQIDQIAKVDDCDRSEFDWASYHPHFHREPDKSNTIYIATRELEIPGSPKGNVQGAGVFECYSPRLQLTRQGSSLASIWQLPQWFFPDGEKKLLTFHSKLERWGKEREYAILRSVGRGQEFVLDCTWYPEAITWVGDLLKH